MNNKARTTYYEKIRKRKTSALVICCCITNDNKLSSLNNTHLLSNNFCGSRIWPQHNWALCLGSDKAVIKMLTGSSAHLEVKLGKNPLLSSLRLLAESSSFVGVGLRSPFPGWLQATVSSQRSPAFLGT